ncbi:MAG: class I SAM-dependent methyltransferase [Polyangia bacterium]|nr:class I SAM-dependent methyltransferase [Polyangia bacterium]
MTVWEAAHKATAVALLHQGSRFPPATTGEPEQGSAGEDRLGEDRSGVGPEDAAPGASREAFGKAPDVPFAATPQAAVEKMLELAELRTDDVLYDLGCGDGRIVITAAKKYGVRAMGYDIDPVRVKESRENVRKAGVEHLVTIRRADVLSLDLSGATVITLFMMEAINVALMPRLRRLKPGSRILSYRFGMGAAIPHQTVRDTFGAGVGRTIYKWVVPWEERGAPPRRPTGNGMSHR